MFLALGMKIFSAPIHQSEIHQSEIAEETIIDSMAQEFSNVRATRFVKR